MLRSNLSTRPFYNDRAVTLGLLAGGAVALVLTLFNGYQILLLQGQTRDARATIAQNDGQAQQLRSQAADVRRSVDAARLEAIQTSAREANALIDQRIFSWSALFNQFEATLPDGVRLSSVHPAVDKDHRIHLSIAVVARNIEPGAPLPQPNASTVFPKMMTFVLDGQPMPK